MLRLLRLAPVRCALVWLLVGLTLTTATTGLAQDATPAASPATAAIDCPDLTAGEVTELATAFIGALNSGDRTELRALITPDYVQHWGLGNDTVGADDYIASGDTWREVFSDMTWSIRDIVAGEDGAAIIWSETATQSRPFMGFPASDHPVTWSGIFAFREECGRLAETWTEVDHFGRLRAQGSLPASVATPTASTSTSSATPAQTSTLNATPAEGATGCAPMPSEDVNELAEAYIAAREDQDLERLASLLAPDYVHHWGRGFDTMNADEFIAGMEPSFTIFPDQTWEINQIIPHGDGASIAFSLTSTQTEPLLGFPASDRPVTWTGIFTFRAACGQIAETWTQIDHLGRIEAQGWLPAPAATPAP